MKAILYPSAPITAPQWQDVSADRVIDGAPRECFEVIYTSASGEFTTGNYQCTPGKWRISYTEDEFMTLLEGTLRLVNETGEVQEFTAPCSFTIPAGFKGTWEALTNLRKHFVIYEKAA